MSGHEIHWTWQLTFIMEKHLWKCEKDALINYALI